MSAVLGFNAAVIYEDPPFEMSGMVRSADRSGRKTPGVRSGPSAGGGVGSALGRVRLDPAFSSRRIGPVPVPARGSAVDPAGKLGRARGVDRRRSLYRSDTARGSRGVARAAGVFPHRRSMDRSREDGAPAAGRTRARFSAIIYLVLVAACLLAWYNFRARRVDQRGAANHGCLVFCVHGGQRFSDDAPLRDHPGVAGVLACGGPGSPSTAVSSGFAIWRWSHGCGGAGLTP